MATVSQFLSDKYWSILLICTIKTYPILSCFVNTNNLQNMKINNTEIFGVKLELKISWEWSCPDNSTFKKKSFLVGSLIGYLPILIYLSLRWSRRHLEFSWRRSMVWNLTIRQDKNRWTKLFWTMLLKLGGNFMI